MTGNDRTLVTRGGLLVVGTIERVAQGSQVLACTRSLEVINGTSAALVIPSVLLRGAGRLAASRPPYEYTLSRVIPAGVRAPVLNSDVFRLVERQPQAPGAVRPFAAQLLASGWERKAWPQVILRLRQDDDVVEVEVPVLQLGSDARGRLFHVGMDE